MSLSHSKVNQVLATGAADPSALQSQFAELRDQIAAAEAAGERPMPGNARFLADGRVLCRPRARGDSRYPYGRDGLHFWVHASGYMHGNQGQYFALLPAHVGQEPPVAFFVGRLREDGTYLPLPILPVPYVAAAVPAVRERFTVFGHTAAYFGMRTDELFSGLRVSVDQTPDDRTDIIFSLLVVNETSDTLALHAASYINPFCRHQFAESAEDIWFKRIEVVPQPSRSRIDSSHAPPVLVSVNEDVDRFRSVTNRACIRRATSVQRVATDTCTARRVFLGDPVRSLGEAASLQLGRFGARTPITTFNDVAVAADLQRFSLAPGSTARFDYVFSLPDSDCDVSALLGRPLIASDIDAALADQQQATDANTASFRMTFGDSAHPDLSAKTLNAFLPFLSHQVRVCAEISGYMQPAPNSLIGVRDVFQAIEGYLYEQPAIARSKILEALEFVLLDGRCPRQYSLPANGTPGPVDLREFIDQGLWVVSAVYTYLCVTADWNLLRETVGYHEVVPGKDNAIRPAGRRDTVLEHLLRIMDYLDRQRDPATRLLRILYGDWNDAVDGLGTPLEPGAAYGTGVSVMASLQLYCNCHEMAQLLRQVDAETHARRIAEYEEMAAELREGLLRYALAARGEEQRIMHGWGDRRRYFVGSFEDSDGQARDSLTSNAFWVLSGMLAEAPGLRPHIRSALSRLDGHYGLRTFAPSFKPDAPGVGRVRHLPPGTAENGATYVHATLFGVWAQFEMGAADEAWQQIQKVLPFSPHHRELSHSPFVIPNSYVDNAALGLTGQSMNDWQTGSSNVLLKVLVRCVCGFRPGLSELEIAPADKGPLQSFDFRATAHGRPIEVRYRRAPVRRREIRLSGVPLNVVRDEQRELDVARVPYDRLQMLDNVFLVTDPAAK